ncbi:hypothetical protein AM233_06575 [Bacillus sp. FJAT-22058]|nr:hypothetical protein AM233_06575 [Bacillus sp. FJAT-22058]
MEKEYDSSLQETAPIRGRKSTFNKSLYTCLPDSISTHLIIHPSRSPLIRPIRVTLWKVLPFIFIFDRPVKTEVTGGNPFVRTLFNALVACIAHIGMYRTVSKFLRFRAIVRYRFNLIAYYTFNLHIS